VRKIFIRSERQLETVVRLAGPTGAVLNDRLDPPVGVAETF
jgi:hypothetical protein